MKQWCFSER